MSRKEKIAELKKYLGHEPCAGSIYDTNVNFSNDEELRKYYRTKIEEYCSHLSNYDNTVQAEKILSYLEEKENFSPPSKKVLDFGCGLADFAIVFAMKGYAVYISDLKEMLDFAEWRLKERSLECTRVEIDDKFQSILPKNLDLVIVADCIEHLRNPMEKLKEIHESLNEGGFFWYTFPSEPSNGIGDHLKEAIPQRDALMEFLNINFIQLKDIGIGYLWKKKKKQED